MKIKRIELRLDSHPASPLQLMGTSRLLKYKGSIRPMHPMPCAVWTQALAIIAADSSVSQMRVKADLASFEQQAHIWSYANPED